MLRHRYPDIQRHQTAHREFLDRIGGLQSKVETGRPEAIPELFNYVSGWLMDHMVKEDKALAHFLNQRRAA